MKWLIIYAHPNQLSFNNAIRKTVVDELTSNGVEYCERDLYSLGFDPVLSSADFNAMHSGTQLPDVLQEQKHITESDVIVFIYPIWWAGMPAIVKGYIDRVFSHGFAYRINGGNIEPLLAGRRAIVINTMGTPYDVYYNSGMVDSIKLTVQSGILSYVGLDVVAHVMFGGVPSSELEERQGWLLRVKELTKRVLQTPTKKTIDA